MKGDGGVFVGIGNEDSTAGGAIVRSFGIAMPAVIAEVLVHDLPLD